MKLYRAFVAILILILILPNGVEAGWIGVGCTGNPTQQYDFISGTPSLPSDITHTGATNGAYYNSAGVSTANPANAARFDYNPISLAANGLLLEEAVQETVPNSSMAGASVGVRPTGWASFVPPSGITQAVSNVGTENGLPFIDVQFSGSSTGGTADLIPMSSSGYAGDGTIAVGQTWTGSWTYKLVGGTTSNVSNMKTFISEYNGGGFNSEASSGSVLPTSTIAANTLTRTLASATTNWLRLTLRTTLASGAVNFTIRVYPPHLQKVPNSNFTSYIPTSSAFLNRSADSAKVTSISWFNATNGTIYVQAMVPFINTTRNTTLVSFNDGTTNNQIRIILNASGVPEAEIDIGGVASTSGGSLPAVTPNMPFQLALSYQATANFFSANGTLDTAGTFGGASLPTGITQMTMGMDGASGQLIDGWEQLVKYWNAPYSRANTITLTDNLYTIKNWDTAALVLCQRIQPTATDCLTGLVQGKVPAGCSGPITISAGGTYDGSNYSGGCIQGSPGGHAVTLGTSQHVVLQNMTLAGSGDLVFGRGADVSLDNVTAINTAAYGIGIINNVCVNGVNCKVTNSRLHGAGIFFAGNSGNTPITATNNIEYNLPAGFNGNATHFLQFQGGNFAGSTISGNVALNAPGASGVNDVMNFYDAVGTSGSPITVSGNYLVGGYAYPDPINGSTSGAGIISDGSGAATSGSATQFLRISGNIVISQANVGIAFAAGHDNATDGTNIIVKDGYALGQIQQQPTGNVGEYNSNFTGQGAGVFGPNAMNNDSIYWFHPNTLGQNNTSFSQSACSPTCTYTQLSATSSNAAAYAQEATIVQKYLGYF